MCNPFHDTAYVGRHNAWQMHHRRQGGCIDTTNAANVYYPTVDKAIYSVDNCYAGARSSVPFTADATR